MRLLFVELSAPCGRIASTCRALAKHQKDAQKQEAKRPHAKARGQQCQTEQGAQHDAGLTVAAQLCLGVETLHLCSGVAPQQAGFDQRNDPETRPFHGDKSS